MTATISIRNAHKVFASMKEEYAFFRTNIGALRDEPPTRLTEAEALQLLAVVFKDPQRAINRLKKGDKLETRYATYVARRIA